MATKPAGHQCDFIDPVPEDYICKQCNQVARSPTVISCCGECFCKLCVDLITQDKLPCPGCEETVFTSLNQIKYQKKILALKVHCSMKDQGCEWSGQLQQLEPHMNADTGSCQYIDVDCPKCSQKVQRCKLSTHLSDLCPNRDYICSYCNFKGSYERVYKEHWDECPYYPLQCPNRCGVSCEREMLKDHLMICSLSERFCEFKPLGCSDSFHFEDLERHMENNTHKHLGLLVTAMSEMKIDFEEKVSKLEKRLATQEQELREKHEKVQALEIELTKKPEKQNEGPNICGGTLYDITISKVSGVVPGRGTIKYGYYVESQPMYTHPCGYKFKVGVYPGGIGTGVGSHMSVLLTVCKGDYDEKIKWPAVFTVTLVLVNWRSDKGHYKRNIECNVERKDRGSGKGIVFLYEFLSHSELELKDEEKCYVMDGKARFRIRQIVVSDFL